MSNYMEAYTEFIQTQNKGAGMIVTLVSVMMFAIAVCGYLVETGRLAEEKLLIPAIIFCVIIAAAVAIGMFYKDKYCKI